MQYILHNYSKNLDRNAHLDSHAGSWFGLPDFGVTEALGGLFGAQRTPQGGSNISAAFSPSQKAQTPQVNGTNTGPGGAFPIAGGNQSTPSYSAPTTQSAPSNGGMSLREQMNKGLIPWDDNKLAAENQNNVSEEARRREEEARNTINSGYDEYENRLRGMEGSYGASRDQELSSTGSSYDKIFGGLQEQKQANVDKLEANKGQVKQREAGSIKDLQQNLSSVVRGMSMQLGGMGAGDTSASQTMMPYAYTKIAGQQEGGIHKQSNQQLFDIDTQQKDTELKFSDMWRQTEVDKESQLQNVRNYYGDAIGKVQMALANAPVERQGALSSLATSLLADAKNRLSTLEAQTTQRQQDIQNWAADRMSNLNNLRLTLAGSANFSPQDITFQELQMMGANPGTGATSGQSYNPMAVAQKRRDEYFA